METWMSVSLVLVSLTIFMIFVFLLDWVIKRRRTVKKNNIASCASGYGILYGKEDENTIIILSGFLGANSTELVFEHHFKDDTSLLKEELSTIRCLKTSEFSESEFLEFVYRHCSVEGKKTRYVIEGMEGLSIIRRIPMRIKKRMLCQIGLADGTEFFYSYKNTANNAAAIDVIRQYIH